jgi:hypothetical protein
MKSGLANFAKDISKLGLTEVGCAIALLWYFDQKEGRSELRPDFLAGLMHDLSLRQRVSATRLGRQLLAHHDVMRGREMGTVRLRRASKSRISSRYNKIAKPTNQSETDWQIIPAGLFENSFPHLEALAIQINGTYQAGFYDACAVMCRRLLGCMLLLAFEGVKKGEVVRDIHGEYLDLAELIPLASSSRHIKLARRAGTVMRMIEYVGELAASHPAYITQPTDIDKQGSGFRRLITELIRLAEIKPKAVAGASDNRRVIPSSVGR